MWTSHTKVMSKDRNWIDYAQLGLTAAQAYKVNEMASELGQLRQASAVRGKYGLVGALLGRILRLRTVPLQVVVTFVLLLSLAGRAQEPTKSAISSKETEIGRSDTKQRQGVDKSVAERLVREFTDTLRSKIWESLRGSKDPDPIRRFIASSVEFFQEKGFSPEQLALARAMAFDRLWDSINEYAHMLVTSEAAVVDHRDTTAKFIKVGEELISDANVRREALRLAVTKGKAELVDWLTKHGADLNEKAGGGLTALMFATIQNDKRVVEALLKDGANPNLRNSDGMTALMFAVQAGNNDLVTLLLSKRADPSIKDNRGQSALGMAKDSNQLESVVLLKDAGAKE
jgi:hypothetical protein